MEASIPPPAFSWWEGVQPSLPTREFHGTSCRNVADTILVWVKPSGHLVASTGDLGVWVCGSLMVGTGGGI